LLLSAADSGALWRDPGPIGLLNLAAGPGGQDKAPKPPFTFVQEELTGTTPKVTVTDSRGARWSVKFGEEVKAENFASRILWAAGYFAEPTYFVSEGMIAGVGKLGRAAPFIDKSTGHFKDARFQLRDPAVRPIEGAKWGFDDSALKGSRELAGLKILLVLLSNWDVKPENMAVMETNGQRVLAMMDWGASMGRASDISGRSKWDCKLYAADTKYLIEGVENGFVVVNYQGKNGPQVRQGIRLTDVEWLMQRLGRLSDAQIGAALKASGATPEEAACFGQAFRSRLAQFMSVKDNPPDTTVTRTRREVKTTIRTQPQ
jgi:hypothetical protein